jgi:hypothetical protein
MGIHWDGILKMHCVLSFVVYMCMATWMEAVVMEQMTTIV